MGVLCLDQWIGDTEPSTNQHQGQYKPRHQTQSRIKYQVAQNDRTRDTSAASAQTNLQPDPWYIHSTRRTRDGCDPACATRTHSTGSDRHRLIRIYATEGTCIDCGCPAFDGGQDREGESTKGKR